MLEALAGSGAGSLIGTVIVVSAAVVALALAVRFARGVRRDPELAAALEAQVGRSADDWRADAADAEQSGRWRDALRCRYRALLADLAAAGLLEEVPGRTTGEYLRAVRTDVPDAADAFTAATQAFEEAWYGSRVVDRADVEAFAGHARDVVAVAGARRAPAVAARAS